MNGGEVGILSIYPLGLPPVIFHHFVHLYYLLETWKHLNLSIDFYLGATNLYYWKEEQILNSPCYWLGFSSFGVWKLLGPVDHVWHCFKGNVPGISQVRAFTLLLLFHPDMDLMVHLTIYLSPCGKHFYFLIFVYTWFTAFEKSFEAAYSNRAIKNTNRTI